jgi:hypothetical protein
VLFLDDDVLFRPDLIGFHLENYRSAVGAVSGKVSMTVGERPWAACLTSSGKYLRNLPPTGAASSPPSTAVPRKKVPRRSGVRSDTGEFFYGRKWIMP